MGTNTELRKYQLPTYWQMLPYALIISFAMGTLYAMQVYIVAAFQQSGDALPEVLNRYGRNIFWGFAAPVIILFTFRHPLRGSESRRSIVYHVGFYLVFTFVYAVFRMFYHYYVEGSSTILLEWKIRMAHGLNNNLWQYVPAVIAGELLLFAESVRDKELQAAELKSELLEAQLSALRAQIQPHFLFNTLNSILSLVPSEPKLAERTIVRLGSLLRSTVEYSGSDETALRDELDLLNNYLEIEKTRLGPRLTVSIDVAEELKDAVVPSLLLQPVAENAIRHAVGKIAGPGLIEIVARREGDTLCFAIRDNGPGPSPAPRKGVGLTNTRARLEHLYGDRSHFELQARPEGGAEVRIRLPYREIERPQETQDLQAHTKYAGVGK